LLQGFDLFRKGKYGMHFKIFMALGMWLSMAGQQAAAQVPPVAAPLTQPGLVATATLNGADTA
jgi:hypothetical protein